MTPDNISASAVNSLRVKSLLDEVPKTLIAKAVGMNRQVVARHLKSGDMRLSEFIKTAHALGADPVKVLADAVTEEKKKAPAATGAE
ncbi:MAG: hypothetical protein SOI13_01110 [Bifidobacterium mongoliense]|jgi:hypothetical protein|uniref:hypothetical protein n=2 Tax=Bifidobacterium mongoliense TaxID=518643 RepID=UPI002F34F8B3